MSFLENTRNPNGLGGKVMVSLMNVCHRPLAHWGLRFVAPPADARVLDCGCGGGANIRRLLKKCPQGIVKGLDYSPVSVEKARRVNEGAIRSGRCVVLQGSVTDMLFASDWFDLVTAFETVYFWPDLLQAFQEVCRVLKPDGTFLLCNECSGAKAMDDKWQKKIDGMTVYRDVQMKAALEQAGFRDVHIQKNRAGWLCITAKKAPPAEP